MAISRYLDLSTGHLKQETMRWLSQADPTRSNCAGMTIAAYEYGAFVSVPEEDRIGAIDCPEDLKVVLRYARKKGLGVIRFDADAEVLADLIHFDWE